MTATVKRIERGKYAFVWAETGKQIYFAKDNKREPMPTNNGDKTYAEHMLNRWQKMAKVNGVELV